MKGMLWRVVKRRTSWSKAFGLSKETRVCPRSEEHDYTGSWSESEYCGNGKIRGRGDVAGAMRKEGYPAGYIEW